jgi:hypothetical protein
VVSAPRERVLIVTLALCASLLSSCSAPEDPARTQLRERLREETRLTDDEVRQVIAEVGQSLAARTVRIKEGADTRELNAEQRDVVFSMLRDPVGVYDEGLRQADGKTYRVLNGPGRSDNAEIEALQRLWIDLGTFLPGRYQFAYAFPGYGDYEYQLIVQP